VWAEVLVGLSIGRRPSANRRTGELMRWLSTPWLWNTWQESTRGFGWLPSGCRRCVRRSWSKAWFLSSSESLPTCFRQIRADDAGNEPGPVVAPNIEIW